MDQFLQSKKNFLDWYKKTSRLLPWRETHDPYKIWVSEIFLQQTQALRVVSFYTRMIEAFPTVQDLSAAEWEDFLPYFQGLGFYSRGKNMLKTAKIITDEYGGVFPCNATELQKLPGIGDYTAHALMSFAYKQSVPALDTNLFRVLGRFWGLEENQTEIRKKAFAVYSHGDGDILNHALMDLGASLCQSKKIECEGCPLRTHCQFRIEGKTIDIQKKKSSFFTKKKAQEVSVPLIRKDLLYLLQKKESGKWGLPAFFRDPKNLLEKDHRHFLKDQSDKKWNIHISVRPPFFGDEQYIDSQLFRFRYSRCQILSGEVEENNTLKFLSIDDIKKIKSSGKLEDVYSDVFLEKWWKMRK